DADSHSSRVSASSADCSKEHGNTVTKSAADGAGDPVPTFAGIRTATDIDACTASGVMLTWDAATFGPSGGTYKIWRDGSVIASGIAAAPYTDVPGDSASHVYR